MNQFFIGIIIVLSLGGYYLYQQNEVLVKNNAALEVAVKEQQDAIASIKENFERQSEALSNLTRQNAQIEADKAKYLSILTKHNFEKLSVAKPGLMELRFNKGTEEVIRGIEDDSKAISNLESTSSND